MNPTTTQNLLSQKFDINLSRVLKRRFQLFERPKIESPQTSILLDWPTLSPREFHQFQHLYILYSFSLILLLLQNVMKEDPKFGYTKTLWFKAFLPFTISQIANFTIERKKKKTT